MMFLPRFRASNCVLHPWTPQPTSAQKHWQVHPDGIVLDQKRFFPATFHWEEDQPKDNWLVVSTKTPLKNDGVKVSWGYELCPTEWEVRIHSMVPVTTNQITSWDDP